MIAKDLASSIGNTPLIKLRAASEATGCTILGKAEFANPGQSVKDRAALYIIRDAEEKGLLRPGGTIVEGTAGNTGIGLGLVGASLGYKSVIVIPDTQSQEKKDMLRLTGAKLVQVPAVPYRNPNNYVKYSKRLADELNKTETNGAIWANQFDNVANRQAHVETTGPEIWAQTEGKVNGFVCSCRGPQEHVYKLINVGSIASRKPLIDVTLLRTVERSFQKELRMSDLWPLFQPKQRL